MKDNRIELQKKFEEQTPTIKGVGRVEYLQTFVSWLHLQIENSINYKKETCDFCGGIFEKNIVKLCSGCQSENNI